MYTIIIYSLLTQSSFSFNRYDVVNLSQFHRNYFILHQGSNNSSVLLFFLHFAIFLSFFIFLVFSIYFTQQAHI